MPKPKVARADLKPGEFLCQHCTAKCCRYFALPLETPNVRNDFDYFRWYLIHGRVSIFVDDDTWYLMVHNDCDHLQEDHRCGIYQDRPQICRDYTTDDCEYDGDNNYDMLFECPEQIVEYAEAFLPQARRAKVTGRQPKLSLPILSAVPESVRSA
ncbi:MAG: YkgJ family cysteine cluster protein [Planctomycetes bacterium]|nr:YkgJ family cysteine cluster protein [Planctomycetota bacterium]